MSTTVDTTTEIQSFQIEIPEAQIDDLPLPRPRLRQRGRPGRPLRRLGGAGLFSAEVRAAFRSLR